MPKKKDKFYIYVLLITESYITLNPQMKNAHTGFIS